jgi:hypothetical protein
MQQAPHHTPKIPKLAHLVQLVKKFAYNWVSGEIINRKTKKVIGPNTTGYVKISISRNSKGIHFNGHHFAWFMCYGRWPRKLIDHIDGNPGNNAISNLQELDQSTNTRKGKLGVYKDLPSNITFWTVNGKYQVRFTENKKLKHLGYFSTLEEAKTIRDNYLLELEGNTQ